MRANQDVQIVALRDLHLSEVEHADHSFRRQPFLGRYLDFMFTPRGYMAKYGPG